MLNTIVATLRTRVKRMLLSIFNNIRIYESRTRNYLSNNKGSALVTTLLIITLIFIFSSVLTFTVFNSIKQTQLSENQIQASNLAEMAVMYFEEYTKAQVKVAEDNAKSFLSENPEATADQLTELFCSQFQLSPINNISVTSNTNFKAKISSVSINRSNCDQIFVKFTGTGTYKGFSKDIRGSFYIQNHSTFPDTSKQVIGFPPIPANFTNTCSDLDLCNGKSNAVATGKLIADKKDTITVNGLYINGSLNMSVNQSDLIIRNDNLFVNGLTSIGNKSSIIVQNGNGYFRDITGATNAEIHINGDVYIFGDVTRFKTNSGNQLLIKATGTVYVADNSDLPTNYQDYCNVDKSRGICGSLYSTLSKSPLNASTDSSEPILSWSVDEPSMTIEYQ